MINMKTLNITFTCEEYQQLKQAKGTKNWHDFILNKCVQSDVPDSIKGDEK